MRKGLHLWIRPAIVLSAVMAIVMASVLPRALWASGSEPLDRIVYTSNRGGLVDLWSANVDGSAQTRLTTDPLEDTHADVSPDGTKIAFVRGMMSGSVPIFGHLWVMDADGSNARALFDGPGTAEYRPNWSPDGSQILFSRSFLTGGPHQLWVVDADGANAKPVKSNASYGAWSPDGTRIAYNGIDLPNIQIWVSQADGTAPRQLTSVGTTNVAPRWSPDGTRISFTSYRNGNGEVWVMDDEGSQQRSLAASPGKDGLATWAPSGQRIAFGSTRHTRCPPQLTENCPHRLFTMTPDGLDLQLVADNALSDMWPAYFPRAGG